MRVLSDSSLEINNRIYRKSSYYNPDYQKYLSDRSLKSLFDLNEDQVEKAYQLILNQWICHKDLLFKKYFDQNIHNKINSKSLISEYFHIKKLIKEYNLDKDKCCMGILENLQEFKVVDDSVELVSYYS